MTISSDSQVILLLCSQIGLSSRQNFSPLNLKEWNLLSRKLQFLSLRPESLLGFSAEDFSNKLNIGETETNRIISLLQRSGFLAIELERLESLGIKVLTRADEDYPIQYRQRLKESAPSILFFSGEKALLGQPGIAVVGSRHLDEIGKECAEFIGNACGRSGLVLYSGGAKGVDHISTNAALSARGTAVSILADNMENVIRIPEYREAIKRGDLCLLTNYSPNAPFSVGRAMGRNKLIYTLSKYALVVSSDAEKGGTWAGATEALKAKWLPVFVLDHPSMSEGNKFLIKQGASRFPHPFPEDCLELENWLMKHSPSTKTDPQQPRLF